MTTMTELQHVTFKSMYVCHILYLCMDNLGNSLNDFSHVAKIKDHRKSQWSEPH